MQEKFALPACVKDEIEKNYAVKEAFEKAYNLIKSFSDDKTHNRQPRYVQIPRLKFAYAILTAWPLHHPCGLRVNLHYGYPPPSPLHPPCFQLSEAICNMNSSCKSESPNSCLALPLIPIPRPPRLPHVPARTSQPSRDAHPATLQMGGLFTHSYHARPPLTSHSSPRRPRPTPTTLHRFLLHSTPIRLQGSGKVHVRFR